MKRLSYLVCALLISLAVFYNLERLDLREANIIDIDSFVYVLGLASVTSTIIVPVLRHISASATVTLWLSVYFLIKVWLWQVNSGPPLVGEIYTYLTITEIAMLILTTWLAHRVASALREFEETVQRITFTPSKRIRQLQGAYDEIQVEMFRSRHNHHPLSVIIVEPNPESIKCSLHALVQEVQQNMMSSYIINSMAQTLGKYLRQTDMILEQLDKGRFIVLCPETNAADSKLILEYIQSVAVEQLGISVASGVATFPEEAVTFEELVCKAEKRLKSTSGANVATIPAILKTA